MNYIFLAATYLYMCVCVCVIYVYTLSIRSFFLSSNRDVDTCSVLLLQVSLLVQVSSAPGNFHRRRAIRDTWGGTSPLDASDAKLLFLLGNPRDSRIQTQVNDEQIENHACNSSHYKASTNDARNSVYTVLFVKMKCISFEALLHYYSLVLFRCGA